MGRSNKDAWLSGPGDLKEADVQDVPVPGESVRVRGLAAAYSNQAQSEALEYRDLGGESKATINTARLEVLQFAHGVIEPSFSVEEAQQISERFGPAFRKVVAKIDELSGVNKEEIEKAEARFQGSPNGDAGPAAGGGEPSLPLRAGAPLGDDG